MTEVEGVCDRVAILHRGRLRAIGRLDELLIQSDKMAAVAKLGRDDQALLTEQFPDVKLNESGRANLDLPKAEVNRFLDFVTHHQGELISLTPSRLSLEEYYFRVVCQADKDDGVTK